jgi:putative protein-disulfide isomerase
MTDAAQTTLFYVHDPMCSWSYGFAPVWQQLRAGLPPELRVVSLVGGLAPDDDRPMPQEMRDYLQKTWRRIMNQIPGTEFNFDFWVLNTPRRSTFPACRAVISARLIADQADEMTAGIQRAYYREARNPSDLQTLADTAVAIGLDREQFLRSMGSDELELALVAELDFVRAIGVDSFPSLVLQHDHRRQQVPVDYNNSMVMMAEIKRFLMAVFD